MYREHFNDFKIKNSKTKILVMSSNQGKSHEWIEGLTSSEFFWLRCFREMIWNDVKKETKQLGIFSLKQQKSQLYKSRPWFMNDDGATLRLTAHRLK